jgi:hypothetical protein
VPLSRSLSVLLRWAVAALAAAAALAFVAVARERAARPPGEVTRLSATEIEFTATVAASSFNRRFPMPGYHAIVWRDGRAAHATLFRADVTDLQVLDALEALGAKPGDALGMATWDERQDPRSTAPDRVIAGPPVEVLVRLPGRPRPVPLGDLLEDRGGRGVELRFGGHRANIPKWHSGCIVCLYSCPGSKLGNARYTVRDYTKDETRFRARTELLPPDGTRVGIVVRLLAPR